MEAGNEDGQKRKANCLRGGRGALHRKGLGRRGAREAAHLRGTAPPLNELNTFLISCKQKKNY